MCNFSPSWEGILIKIKIFINAQQWKDVQGGHQQVRDFNRFLEDRVKKKKKEGSSGGWKTRKKQKLRKHMKSESAVKGSMYQRSSYRLKYNMVIKDLKSKRIPFQTNTHL